MNESTPLNGGHSDIAARVLPSDPHELRALADRIESSRCTGLSASWCPTHGDCTCPDRATAMDDDRCPLHSRSSSHAAQEVARLGR